MDSRKIVLISCIVLMFVVIGAFIVIQANQLNKSNPLNETLSASQKMDRDTLQSAVNMYLSKIKAENNNKAEPVITSGSINNGNAYATVNGKKYVIDTYSIGIRLPDGKWYLESDGTVTRL